MKAAGKTKKERGIEIFEIEEPTITENELLLQVDAASICGGDLHWYKWDDVARNRTPYMPKIMGHEVTGKVIEVGKNVGDFKIGDRVSVETHIPCGHCWLCKRGGHHLCPDLKIFGIDTKYGAFSERTVVPESVAVKVPDSIDKEVAACLEPLGVAYHCCIERGKVGPGDTVVITGSGPIGIFAQQVARFSGAAFVIGTDIKKKRIELAKKIGAVDEMINAEETDVVKRVLEITNGRGADKIIELSGADGANEQAIRMVAPQGTVVQAGGQMNSFNVKTPDVQFKEITITGSYGRLLFSTWEKVIKLMANKRIDIGPVITHRFDLEKAEEAFATAVKGEGGKVLFVL
jgi:threonine 3-dehydrogenase